MRLTFRFFSCYNGSTVKMRNVMTSLLLANGPLFGANERGIIVFGFEIYFYALCIVTGIIVATCLSALLMKRRNMSPDFIFTLFVFCIPVALICARLFYCITDDMPVQQWFAWNSLREGGLSIVGGALGGILTGLIVCLVKKVNFFRAADCVVITILIAQAIGRWGNFFNKEVYGHAVSSPSMEWFPFAVPVSPSNSVHGVGSFSDPNSTWHYAFFFYESLINAIGFAVLYTLAWKWAKKPNGLFTFAYFAWYGTVRSIMEPLRESGYILSGGGVPWSLVFSILMIVLGLAGIGVLLYFNYRKEGSLIGSKNGDPCGITRYIPATEGETPYYSKINMFGANYPPMPEEETFRYKWNKFLSKFKKNGGGEPPEGPSEEAPKEASEGSPEETHEESPEREDKKK